MLASTRLLARLAVGLTLVAVPGARAAAPAHFQYLIKAANQIQDVEYSKTVLGPDENGRIAKIACAALTQLAEDNDFKEALTGLMSKRNLAAARGRAIELVKDLKEFNAVFLPAELKHLQDAGLQYPAEFLRIASRARTRARLDEISPGQVIEDVAVSREVVCRFAAGIVTDLQRKYTLWTIGGVTLVVVDVAGALGVASASGGALAVGAVAIFVSSTGIGAAAAIDGAKGNVP